jgi:hypothetical protein
MTKVAQVQCPHCGETIRIRKIESVDLPADGAREYSVKELMDLCFDKVFGTSKAKPR